jgi:hypothetical protein
MNAALMGLTLGVRGCKYEVRGGELAVNNLALFIFKAQFRLS